MLKVILELGDVDKMLTPQAMSAWFITALSFCRKMISLLRRLCELLDLQPSFVGRSYAKERAKVSSRGRKDADLEDLRIAIDIAYKEWTDAERYFNNVTDPDLVDHAIYSLRAAEQKYSYFLKKARSQMSRM